MSPFLENANFNAQWHLAFCVTKLKNQTIGNDFRQQKQEKFVKTAIVKPILPLSPKHRSKIWSISLKSLICTIKFWPTAKNRSGHRRVARIN